MLKIQDFSDLRELSQRLVDSVNRLNSLAKPVSVARQIREYSSDRNKRALAVATQAELLQDKELSNAAAESKGRASASYAQEMARLGMELRDAEEVIAQWEAAKCAHEAVRSLISLQKSISEQLRG